MSLLNKVTTIITTKKGITKLENYKYKNLLTQTVYENINEDIKT